MSETLWSLRAVREVKKKAAQRRPGKKKKKIDEIAIASYHCFMKLQIKKKILLRIGFVSSRKLGG